LQTNLTKQQKKHKPSFHLSLNIYKSAKFLYIQFFAICTDKYILGQDTALPLPTTNPLTHSPFTMKLTTDGAKSSTSTELSSVAGQALRHILSLRGWVVGAGRAWVLSAPLSAVDAVVPDRAWVTQVVVQVVA
jgi:hypothetical protein